MPLSRPSTSTSPGYVLRMAALSVMTAGFCMPFTAVAGEPSDEGASAISWALGLGIMSEQESYTDIDRENTPIPLIQVETRYVRVFGPQIEFKLPSVDINDAQQLNFGIVGKYDGSGYEADDAPILDGMSERKGGFWAGARLEWSSDFADASVEWLADVSGNSDGQSVNLGLERTWHIGEHMLLTPRVGAKWQDEKAVDYYFGVRDNEVRFDRPGYTGESGVSAELGLRGVYRFNSRHSILMDVEVTSLADEIQDSPLMDRSTSNSVFLGYIYHF